MNPSIGAAANRCPFMFVSIHFQYARISANSAVKQFVFRVNQSVFGYMGRRTKTFTANVANKRLFVIVGMNA